MKTDNLNEMGIRVKTWSNDPFEDPSTESPAAHVRAYFRNLEDRLIDHIRRADLLVGCVAWLTRQSILEAMKAATGGVAIVVQKEDFLRPDLNSRPDWKARLRGAYEALPAVPSRYVMGDLLGRLDFGTNSGIQPVRCAGNHNRAKDLAFPRMHNKFLVFCKAERFRDEQGDIFNVHPYEVWTGSFNFSWNAGNSLENAVVIRDAGIARAYYTEWEQIEAISEPLDWTSDWCAPEWRIGT